MWDYISAVCGYWQFWVAVAFFAERAAERFFPRSWSWAEPYLTHDRRRWAFLGIAIIAFVYANFRAFDAERSRNQTLAAQLRFTTLGSGDPAAPTLNLSLRDKDCGISGVISNTSAVWMARSIYTVRGPRAGR